MLLVTFILILLIYVCQKWYCSKYRHLSSPGLCLPVLGHAYKMRTKEFNEDPVNEIWRVYKKYQKNGMLYFKQFGINTLWIGDFDTVKYIFNHADGNGRLSSSIQEGFFKASRKINSKQSPGVLFSSKEAWQQQRRFALKTLRDFGFGKQGMEGLIEEEVQALKALLDTKTAETFDMAPLLNLPILNALWKVTVGERFEYEDQKLVDICERLGKVFKINFTAKMGMIFSYPWLLKLPKCLFDYSFIMNLFHDVIDMMQANVMKHQQTLDVNDPRDYTDMALMEIEKTTDTKSSFYGQFGLDNLKVTLFDLFVAGSETTSTTLTWAALYMVRYPEVQAKVQEELDKEVGVDRAPKMEDRVRLPYTEAVIMEIQRHGNIVPLGLRHLIVKDILVNGQIIPAGTLVTPIMAEIMKGEYWGDGQVFRPERFLTEAGRVRKDERLIPFSIGKRQCLGETLARTELFLFFTALVHAYNFLPEVEGELPAEEWQLGITSLPKPFKLRIKPRN